MLFENRLREIDEDFDITKPIAFKVKITKDDNFTRMNILQIKALKNAKKTKIKVLKEEKYTPVIEDLPPLILSLNLMPDSKIVEELFCLAQKHTGNRPLELHIKSKLADVIIESKLKVSDLIVEDAKEIGVYPIS
jgi:DNA polymerase-3 subunit alpha